MTRPLTDREALIAALAEEAKRGAEGEEPEPEELLAYLKGQLSPEDEERVGRKLVACRIHNRRGGEHRRRGMRRQREA